jgi:Fe-Mn family superoxide dismutase
MEGPFKVKKYLKPSNLDGISNDQINQHFSLYEKYVDQSNKLLKLEDHLKNGKGFANSTLRADLLKQISFERNGMILHELYFENLKAGINPNKNGAFTKLVKKSFKSIDNFLEDLKIISKARGEIWVLSLYDIETNKLRNSIIESHEHYITYRAQPLLVMDVWTHAYAVDFALFDKDKYIDSFISNINWDVLDRRAEKLI